MDYRCNLIVDSCCDLPYDMLDIPGVSLIRFPFVMDGQEHVDDMFRSMPPKRFYDAMRDKRRGYPTTAQLPATALIEEFSRACQSGVPTVYLSFDSALSGSFDTAVLVRDEVLREFPDAELYVVDTKLASIAEGLVVLGAIEQREKGLTAKQMVAWAEEARYYVGSEFMVEDFESLRRGGRIPAGVALAGAKLDVKPLLSFDLSGKLTLVGMARGRKKGLRALAEHYAKRVYEDQPMKTVILANADCPKDMQRLRDEVLKADPDVVFTESSIGPVIGSHVGPGMVAIVYWTTDRRKEKLSVADRIAKRVKDKEQG
ncbi:DegV family protein [Curtanaerobium respiraculi]|uniref:DegV family protein n=1 Tax=Curtanaerobium respiraculi TaxID=2949669 RepID=UPI0024B3882E|nr:DegV family protein [Curtanaerobium respiraculi]